MRKIYMTFFTVCLLLSLLPGCSREKPTAADSVKAFYDLYILRDTSGAKSLGMTDEEITNTLTAYDNALSEIIRSNFSASGLEIDDDTMERICQARIDALCRMKAEFTVTSEENDKAVVTLSTTYFDERTLDRDAFYNARDDADAAGYMDSDEYLSFIMETYTKNLITGYKEVTPSRDKKEISVACTIINNTWLPEDMAAFGGQLALAVAGQD